VLQYVAVYCIEKERRTKGNGRQKSDRKRGRGTKKEGGGGVERAREKGKVREK